MSKTTIPSWSISRLQVFEQCQYRAKLQWLDKIADTQPKTAADRGSAIHLEAEDYVLGKGELTHNLRHFSTDLTALKNHASKGLVTVEEEWAFDRSWNVSEWKSGWLRLKCDAVCHLSRAHVVVIDHKGLERSTLIPTPTGWTTMGEIRVGEELFAQDGSVCKVTSKSQIKNLPCFEIKFDDKTVVRCDNEHLWTLSDGRIVPITKLKKNDYINVAKPLQLPKQDLPIHPYVFGLWLADGKHTSSEITKPDQFIWDEIQRCGYELGVKQNTNCRTQTVKGIRHKLIELNVLGNKHIPAIYMRASFEQRLALLQGILDGDGSANKTRKQVVLNTTNLDLAKQYYELALSLGQRVNLCDTLGRGFGKLCVIYWISFRPNGIFPFRMPRKAEICKDFGPGHSARRRVISVNEIPSVETQCIAVDSPDHTFLCTEKFLPTHNTGKRFGNEIKHAVQLQLYAVCALIRYPEVEQVTCELWYLDQNELASFVLHRRQLKKYLAIFDEKGRKFTDTTTFKPNPNVVTCRYCPYHADRQGDCEYGTVVNQQGKMVRPVKPIVAPKDYKVDALFADEAAAFAKLGE